MSTEEAPGSNGTAEVLLGHLRRQGVQSCAGLIDARAAHPRLRCRCCSTLPRQPAVQAPPPQLLPPPLPSPPRSYCGMGQARVECQSGCSCQPTVVEALWEERTSLLQMHQFAVGKGERVLGSGQEGCATQHAPLQMHHLFGGRARARQAGQAKHRSPDSVTCIFPHREPAGMPRVLRG